MLSDIERKILRIIGNYDVRYRRTPTVHEIVIRTGRNRDKVLDVLSLLAQERYIKWSAEDPDYILILEAWERTNHHSTGPTWKVYGSN